MGVGIFAARKIALINAINNLEMMQMHTSMLQQSLSDKACNLAMQQTNIQMNMVGSAGMGGGNMWGAIGQSLSGLGGALGGAFGGANANQWSQVGGAVGGMVGLVGSLFSKDNSAAYGNNAANAAQQRQYLQIQMELMQIHQQEKRLEASAAQLATQLGMKNKELETVEKAEEKAIQRSGPKYDVGA